LFLQALQQDERNFHCWDYRRTICALARVGDEQELRFSDDMLNTNFSNYSAWHYRSSLLPHLFAATTTDLPMQEARWRAELMKTKSAFYTDPEDSSAWIYSSWLLNDMADTHSM
jgi:geranylgeranyl transferase type-2 subunit alpha